MFKLVNVVTKSVKSFGKPSVKNMVLILTALMLVTMICNLSVSMSFTTKDLRANMFLVPSWSIWNLVPWM
ncbi:uncharacterized protein B0P05DRAFT_552807 [Gilbertella persicaria]|uniref:uncharacterized protein n=1 Tax=Gilbertella persicaria TaxID=101096 RepID=UPI00221E76F5|nr:uncharacterized protein B0P05DRAFT_552807 [Gilbertella persicaria]KAI8066933.1 hypothetical protein B0P05DRAFT_552807 [Gilbertella persicaria]